MRIRPHFIHHLVAALVVLGGVYDLVDALWARHPARLGLLADWLPLEVHQGGRALLVLAGLVLIGLGRGLGRGKRRAWQLASLVVCASLVLHLMRSRHPAFLLPPLALLVYLVRERRNFIAGSDPVSTRRSLLLAPVLLAAVVVYGSVGQYRLRHSITPPFGWGRAVRAALLAAVFSDSPGVAPLTRQADAFLDSIPWLSVASAVLLVWLLLRPVILRRLDPAFPEARSLIRRYGGFSTAAFAAEPDKHHFLAAGGRAVVAYRVSTRVAVTLGDPIGPPEAVPSAVDEFLAHCRRHDWVPCFFIVSPAHVGFYQQRGLRTLKMAEEAVIPLARFHLHGARMQKLRQSIHRVEREHPDLEARFFDGAPPEEIEEQLEIVSNQWLARKRVSELGFAQGRFDPSLLPSQTLAVACERDRVFAFVSWRVFAVAHPAPNVGPASAPSPQAASGLVLDLMRYADHAPKFVMDWLIARALLHFQQQGFAAASLANASFANTAPVDEFTRLDRGVRFLYENLRGIYEFKSLFQFKKKFNPEWQGRYVAFPSLEALPRIGIALARIHHHPPAETTLLG
ncbi:MAG: bifunctional lysylphosphatidylglycerol flippase/synthetase MprF [Terriglobia bacterium]